MEHVKYQHYEWFAMNTVAYIILVAEKTRSCLDNVVRRWSGIGAELLEESADLRAFRHGSNLVQDR